MVSQSSTGAGRKDDRLREVGSLQHMYIRGTTDSFHRTHERRIIMYVRIDEYSSSVNNMIRKGKLNMIIMISSLV